MRKKQVNKTYDKSLMYFSYLFSSPTSMYREIYPKRSTKSKNKNKKQAEYKKGEQIHTLVSCDFCKFSTFSFPCFEISTLL